MELRHLRYFTIAAEELHFGRAAERLNIAGSTLTVQIQEIERRLGAQLFTRTKRSVALTQVGEVFLFEAREALARFAQAESVGRRAARGDLGRVVIGFVGSAAYAGVLQDQKSRFARDAPQVRVEVGEYPMEKLPNLILEGRIDVGFVRLPMPTPSALSTHVLLRDHFCLALEENSSLSRLDRPISPGELANESFVAPEQRAGTIEIARLGGFSPKIISTPGSLFNVLTEVSLGLGVSVIPSVACGVVRIPGVAFKVIAGETLWSEVAAVYRTQEHSPAVKRMIAQITASDAVVLHAGNDA